ncbi:MAG: hypothetical protein ABR540_11885 [Acidimicrobiales bacterium]
MPNDPQNSSTPDRDNDPDPMADQVKSAVLEDEEGEPYVVDQQNMGPDPETDGAGEWPSPSESPPEAPAPGAA